MLWAWAGASARAIRDRRAARASGLCRGASSILQTMCGEGGGPFGRARSELKSKRRRGQSNVCGGLPDILTHVTCIAPNRRLITLFPPDTCPTPHPSTMIHAALAARKTSSRMVASRIFGQRCAATAHPPQYLAWPTNDCSGESAGYRPGHCTLTRETMLALVLIQTELSAPWMSTLACSASSCRRSVLAPQSAMSPAMGTSRSPDIHLRILYFLISRRRQIYHRLLTAACCTLGFPIAPTCRRRSFIDPPARRSSIAILLSLFGLTDTSVSYGIALMALTGPPRHPRAHRLARRSTRFSVHNKIHSMQPVHARRRRPLACSAGCTLQRLRRIFRARPTNSCCAQGSDSSPACCLTPRDGPLALGAQPWLSASSAFTPDRCYTPSNSLFVRGLRRHTGLSTRPHSKRRRGRSAAILQL